MFSIRVGWGPESSSEIVECTDPEPVGGGSPRRVESSGVEVSLAPPQDIKTRPRSANRPHPITILVAAFINRNTDYWLNPHLQPIFYPARPLALYYWSDHCLPLPKRLDIICDCIVRAKHFSVLPFLGLRLTESKNKADESMLSNRLQIPRAGWPSETTDSKFRGTH